MSSSNLPPPAWYHDPYDPTLQRYWDGSAWTENTAPLARSTQSFPADALARLKAEAIPLSVRQQQQQQSAAVPAVELPPAAPPKRRVGAIVAILAAVAALAVVAAVGVGVMANRSEQVTPIGEPGTTTSAVAKTTAPSVVPTSTTTSTVFVGDPHDATTTGLEAAVRKMYDAYGARDFAAIYELHDSACHAKYDLPAYEKFLAPQLDALEDVLHVKLKNVVVGTVRITDFGSTRATITYVDLKNPTTGLILTDRRQAKPVDWVYESGLWRSTSC